MRVTVVALAAGTLVAAAGTAQARPSEMTGNPQWGESVRWSDDEGAGERRSGRAERGRVRRAARSYEDGDEDSGGRRMNLGAGSMRASGDGARPRQWCGWWMRTQRGGGPQFNVAWNWRFYGSSTKPQVGAVVVWRHHVGEIVGRAASGMWLVRSGNDGGAVRTRPRSVAGAVFRI
jgi:hypothetical protein